MGLKIRFLGTGGDLITFRLPIVTIGSHRFRSAPTCRRRTDRQTDGISLAKEAISSAAKQQNFALNHWFIQQSTAIPSSVAKNRQRSDFVGHIFVGLFSFYCKHTQC